MNPLGYIGIARKAGLLKTGRAEVLRYMERGKLIVIAKDMSKREREKFLKSLKRKIEIIEFGTKEELGKVTGKGLCAVLLFLDRGLAQSFKKSLKEEVA